MRTDGRKQVKGKIIQLPEGTITVLKESEPMMVMVKQSQLVERMDPDFWNAQFVLTEAFVWSQGARRLSEYEMHIAQGDVPRAVHNEKRLTAGHIKFLDVDNVLRTGVCLEGCSFILPHQHMRLRNTQVQLGDLLFCRSGVGSLGRSCVVSYDIAPCNVTSHIDVVRGGKLSTIALDIFLKTRYGIAQVLRRKSGVATIEMPIDRIKDILVPTLMEKISPILEEQYRLIASYHAQAMATKGADRLHQSNRCIRIAEGMLEALIAQVEWLIEDKRRKVTPLLPDNAPKTLQDAFVEQYRRIGETIQRAEAEGWEGVEKIYGMRIYANPLIRDAIRRLLEQVEEVMAGKRKHVEPVL